MIDEQPALTEQTIAFIRNCPTCDKVMSYSCKKALYNANKSGKSCRSCASSGENNAMYGKSGQDSPNYGRHCSDETKEKIAAKHRGCKASPELKQKLSDLRRGENHPNYGKHLSAETRAAISKGHEGKTVSQDVRDKISATLVGRVTYVRTEKIKKKIGDSHRGKPLSEEHKAKIRANAKRGEDNHAWKGGVTSLNLLIRHCSEYDLWRNECFKRDSYRCQMCQLKRNDLHCHHIKHFAIIKEEYHIQTIEDAIQCSLLWDTSNGITLCTDCHKASHKLTREKKMTDEQVKTETTEFKPKLYKLDDNVIGMVRELVQLSLLTGTNLVDHMRTMVVEPHPEDSRFLTLSPGFVESYNRMVASLNEQAEAQMKLAEQNLAGGPEGAAPIQLDA
jgi:hypothetical protein